MNTVDKSLLLKSFMRTVVDACILPGTMMGTELMLLYMRQWKRDWSAISLGLLSLVFSNIAIPSEPCQAPSNASSELEN